MNLRPSARLGRRLRRRVAMSRTRLSRCATVLLGVITVGLSFASVTPADPDDGGWVLDGPNVNPDTWVYNGYMTQMEYNFIKRLRADGVKTPLDTGAIMQVGHLICRNMDRGVPIDNAQVRYFPTATTPQIIAAALDEMCPWNRGKPLVTTQPTPSGRR